MLTTLLSGFSQDGDEKVMFREFCHAMDRMMRGSMEDRLQFVFQLFGAPDPQTKGMRNTSEDSTHEHARAWELTRSVLNVSPELCMGVGDLVRLIQHGNKQLDRVVSFAGAIMSAFDEDDDGDITLCVARGCHRSLFWVDPIRPLCPCVCCAVRSSCQRSEESKPGKTHLRT